MSQADFFSPEARSFAEAVLPLFLPVILCLTAFKLWQTFVSTHKDPASKLPLPPGSFGIPFLGETLSLARQGYDFFRQKRAKYGRIYATHLMGRPIIRIFGKANISRILESEDTLVTMSWPRSVQLLMGEGALGQSTGAVHGQRRAAILQALTPKQVQAFLPLVQKVTRTHISKWQKEAVMSCYTDSRRLALDLTARGLLGLELSDSQLTSVLGDLCTIQENFFSLPYGLPGFGMSKGMAARKSIQRQLDAAVHKAMTSKSYAGDYSQDALSALLASMEANALSLQDVKDSCLEMLFGGLEGISSALCTIMIKLATQKAFHDKAATEVHNWYLNQDRSSALQVPLCIKSIVQEALRVTPPVGGGYRKVLKTFELEGYQIPRGWTVLYSIRDQHECDESVSDVDSFKPDRWSAADGSAEAISSYIPFGGDGPRSCIGQHFAVATLQAITVELLSSCRWSVSGGVEPSFVHFPTPYPAHGTCIKLSAK